MKRPFNHSFVLGLVVLLTPILAAGQMIDLLAAGEESWEPFDSERWQFVDGELQGSTAIFDGDKADPAASAFLVSKQSFTDDHIVSMEVTFNRGRYLGAYVDFGQESQSGIWMATGHALPDDAPDNEVERGYIKTMEDGFWIVRATGEIVIEQGRRLRLGFSRRGDVYSLWNDGKLIANYHKDGGYPAGPLQLRLTNASARIHRLQVRTRKKK